MCRVIKIWLNLNIYTLLCMDDNFIFTSLSRVRNRILSDKWNSGIRYVTRYKGFPPSVVVVVVVVVVFSDIKSVIFVMQVYELVRLVKCYLI